MFHHLDTRRAALLAAGCLWLISTGITLAHARAVPSKDCGVSGVVTNHEGNAIQGARIILTPGGQVFFADMEGKFCITGLEEKDYEILAEMDGYKEQTFAFRYSASRPVQLEVVLQTLLRERVTVEAFLEAGKLEEAPVRVEIVPREMIEKTASRTLADALDFMTGVRVESNCQNCNFSQVRLLGLDGAYSQILIDGQPLISSLAQVYSIEQIPARMVDRIEVIKGGGSAMYGAGAVAGAINVIPREAKENGGWLDSSLGWMAGLPTTSQQGVLDLVSADRNTTFTVFGQIDRTLPLDLDGDSFTEVGKRSLSATGGRITRRVLKEKGKLVFDFGHVWEFRRGGDRLDQPEHFADIAESTRMNRTTVALGWAHYVGANTFYRLAFSTAYSARDSYYGSGQDPNAYGRTESPLFVLDSQLTHTRKNHLLTFGFQQSSDHLRDEQPAYDRYTDDVYRNSGFFVQDTWAFAEKWELLGGLRVDKHNQIARAIVSPRLALQWEPTANWHLRGSVAKGFRPPQVFDEDLHVTQVGGAGAVIRNARNLRHERAISYMLGSEWTPAFGVHRLLLETNFFRTRISDLFKVVEVDDLLTPELEFQRKNLGRAAIYGVELNGGYAYGSRFMVEIGHVRQRGRHDTSEPDFGSLDFFRTPNHHSNLTMSWMNPRWADLFFGVKQTGSMWVPHYAGYIPQDRLEKVPAYVTFDANVSRVFERHNADQGITVTIGVKNITNAYQRDLDQGPLRDSGYVHGPRFPRTFYANLKLNF